MVLFILEVCVRCHKEHCIDLRMDLTHLPQVVVGVKAVRDKIVLSATGFHK